MKAASHIRHLQIRFFLNLVQLELLKINHILSSLHLKGSGLRILILICLISSTNMLPKNKKILNSNINDFQFNGPNDSRLSQWELGEEGAKKILKNFLKNKVKRYNEDRNDPIIEGTS